MIGDRDDGPWLSKGRFLPIKSVAANFRIVPLAVGDGRNLEADVRRPAITPQADMRIYRRSIIRQ